ncbi:phosphatidate cytidylyltransferase [Legionella birminghamensis]|uniref:Phosphatidate cytidylyltransferase n=1 Tax=Legionella birminghamensis TaxID=28083 RepID=A0A378IDT9_9GAMM|nr:phosphatidate cytidylyltransferase [Legionella birminghamensis]KTC75465.1 phosphatidate cytidylyltransferase [Legionella birminghamensis]STX32691.1 phosphatidate cytidylyltransferase [Legionella birminghamensis]
MFIQRLLTILVMAPLVLLGMYYANYWFFAAVIFLLVLGCGLEWLQLVPVKAFPLKLGFIAILVAALALCYFFYEVWLIPGMIAWLLVIAALLRFPTSQACWGKAGVVAFSAILLLPLFGQSMINIFALPQGKALVVYLLLLIWGADIGAYMAGKQWGRHKLIPAVSPGKSYEGLGGGLSLALAVAVAGYTYFKPDNPIRWFLMALSVILISLVGDLIISMFKRRVHIKDTGHLIPGHGGILDRLDSLIAAAPFFYAWFWMSG